MKFIAFHVKNVFHEKLDFSHQPNEPRRVHSSASKWYVFLQSCDHFVFQTATRGIREAQLQHLIRNASLFKIDPYAEYYGNHK